MSVNTEINRINTQVTTQTSTISSIISLLKTKLGLTVSTGSSGTPLVKNSTSLTNIKNAINGYVAPSSVQTYTENLGYYYGDGNSVEIFPEEGMGSGYALPIEHDGKVFRVVNFTYSSDYDIFYEVVDRSICLYSSQAGSGDYYDITVTYEALP